MISRLMSAIVIAILILLAVGAIWQVAPVSAGFTPTPPPPATSIPPTPIPPTAIPPTATSEPREDKPIPPTATPISPTATLLPPPPLVLPVSGGRANGLNDIESIAVSLAGVLVLLIAAVSLVIRESTRTTTDQ